MGLKIQLFTLSLIGIVYPLGVRAEPFVKLTTVPAQTSIGWGRSSRLATVNPALKSALERETAPASTQAALKAGETITSPRVPTPTPTSIETPKPWPWVWWLLPLSLLGGCALWWKNRRPEEEPMPQSIVPPPPIIPVENAPPDEIADFLESLIDPDLDREARTAGERGVDTAFPLIDPETAAVDPFAAISIEEEDAMLDLSLLIEEDENTPSGFLPGAVPFAVIGAGGLAEASQDFLLADARSHCYELDDRQLLNLADRSNCVSLDVGTHTIKIADGFFRYGSEERFSAGEPLVLLWIFGGRFMNLQTKVEVGQTWVSLNGYEDELVLQVLEPTRLCGLFFDTYAKDNQGQIVLSIS